MKRRVVGVEEEGGSGEGEERGGEREKKGERERREVKEGREGQGRGGGERVRE